MKYIYIIVAALVAAAMTGCGAHDGHDGHDGHEAHDGHEGHDHDPVLITGYSQDYEVFAEATPMAAGEECDILAHFTQLSDFKPLAAAKITAALTAGGQSVSQTEAQPVKPGVWKFHLTPVKSGEATVTFDIAAGGRTSRITVTGLRVYADEHEAEEAAGEATPKSSNAVAFTKEMSWKVDFATAEAAARPMGQVIRTMAQVQPSQGDIRTVTARSAGVVTYASADLTDGRAVAAGQPLFRIDASGMADNNLKVRHAEARSDYEAAKREYERVTALVRERLATDSELTAARRDYERAKAVYDGLNAGFASGASVAASPISGYITQLMVTNGEYVEAGAPLATVAQTRDILIRADIQASWYPLLPAIRGANIRRPGGDGYWSLADLNGHVVSYGRSVDTANPLVPVVFRVNNAGGLLPGSFVEMYITAGDAAPVVTVPAGALVEEMGTKFVYVQLTPEYFEKREVKTGRTDGVRTEVLSGVAEGERVVSRGAVLVKLAQSQGALDPHAGHVH